MPKRQRNFVLLLLICALALLLRLYRLNEQTLWFDEIFGATFAAQSFMDMVIAELRFDIHPPIWYVQVYFWSFVSHQDYWLLFNSVLWSVGAVATIYFTSRSLTGSTTALIAAALLAVAPTSVMYAQFVRMYAMLMVLVPMAWYFNHTYLTGRHGRRALGALVVLELLIAYSHGIGVMTVFYLGIYGCVLPLQSHIERQRMRPWFLWQIGVAILSLGSVANGLVRKVTHTPAPDFHEFANTLTTMWLGPLWTDSWLVPVALLLTAAILIGAVCFRRGRAIAIAFVFAPLATGLAVSCTIKPMWHVHALIFALPFYVLSLVLLARNLLRAARLHRPAATRLVAAGMTTIAFITLACFSVDHLRRFERGTDFAWAAAELQQRVQPGDAIFVPQKFDFWGVARYYVSPDWGSPLAVQQIELPEDRWGQLLTRIGPKWRERLHLEPATCFIEHEGVRIYVGDATQQRVLAERPEHIFFLQSRCQALPRMEGYLPVSTVYLHEVNIILFERACGPSVVFEGERQMRMHPRGHITSRRGFLCGRSGHSCYPGSSLP